MRRRIKTTFQFEIKISDIGVINYCVCSYAMSCPREVNRPLAEHLSAAGRNSVPVAEGKAEGVLCRRERAFVYGDSRALDSECVARF